jgi:hypothetical protein
MDLNSNCRYFAIEKSNGQTPMALEYLTSSLLQEASQRENDYQMTLNQINDEKVIVHHGYEGQDGVECFKEKDMVKLNELERNLLQKNMIYLQFGKVLDD